MAVKKPSRKPAPKAAPEKLADKWRALRAELEALAGRLNIVVRSDARLTGGGGFCRVYGAPFIFVNSTLDERDQVQVIAAALAAAGAREALDALPLRPRERRLLEELAGH